MSKKALKVVKDNDLKKPMNVNLNVSLAVQELLWQPSVSLSEGISRLVDYHGLRK